MKKTIKKIILFDTSIATGNKGDEIIMRSINKELRWLFDSNDTMRLPTHLVCFPLIQQISWRSKYVRDADLKFVSGTDLLKTNMLWPVNQWNIHLITCKPHIRSILLGVGNSENSKGMNAYTKALYHKVLDKEYYHSVRDEETKKMVEELGFKVINTGCPTLWSMTPDFCSSIPRKKTTKVLFTLPEKNINPQEDQELINIVNRNYEKIMFWPQAVADLSYLKRLSGTDNFIIIPPSINELDRVLSQGNLDYVGTRLHCGIFALQHKVRSIIISVDHRSMNIDRNNNIGCIPRENLSQIEERINSEFSTEIHIDTDAIEKWKSQFV